MDQYPYLLTVSTLRRRASFGIGGWNCIPAALTPAKFTGLLFLCTEVGFVTVVLQISNFRFSAKIREAFTRITQVGEGAMPTVDEVLHKREAECLAGPRE
jgi:hypothetical protein